MLTLSTTDCQLTDGQQNDYLLTDSTLKYSNRWLTYHIPSLRNSPPPTLSHFRIPKTRDLRVVPETDTSISSIKQATSPSGALLDPYHFDCVTTSDYLTISDCVTITLPFLIVLPSLIVLLYPFNSDCDYYSTVPAPAPIALVRFFYLRN